MSHRMLFGWANFFGVWNFFAASLLTSLPHCWPINFFTAPLRSCGLVCIALMLYDDRGIVWCSFSSDAARRIFINACQFLLVAGSIHCVLYRALRVLWCADVVAPPISLLNVIWWPAWDWCFASVLDDNQSLKQYSVLCLSLLVLPVESSSTLEAGTTIVHGVLHCTVVVLLFWMICFGVGWWPRIVVMFAFFCCCP